LILDTNALSAFAEGTPSVGEKIARAPGPYLPVIVVGEYRFGLLAARDRDPRYALSPPVGRVSWQHEDGQRKRGEGPL
jgi:predicted nucleic acid-binding protein